VCNERARTLYSNNSALPPLLLLPPPLLLLSLLSLLLPAHLTRWLRWACLAAALVLHT
jgi:hypothetical protein